MLGSMGAVAFLFYLMLTNTSEVLQAVNTL